MDIPPAVWKVITLPEDEGRSSMSLMFGIDTILFFYYKASILIRLEEGKRSELLSPDAAVRKLIYVTLTGDGG